MVSGTTCTDYDSLGKELARSISKRIGNRLNCVFIRDYDTDNYDISFYVVLNVSQENVRRTYREFVDIVTDLGFKHNLVISICPCTRDNLSELEQEVSDIMSDYLTEKQKLKRLAFKTKRIVENDKEISFRTKIRELYNLFNIPVEDIARNYNLTKSEVNYILQIDDSDL